MKSVKIILKKEVIKINRRQFTQSCALDTGLTQKQVNLVLDYFIADIKEKLMAGNEAPIPGIGKIIPIERKINKHLHPVTNQYYEADVCKTIRIKVAPSFKEALNTY